MSLTRHYHNNIFAHSFFFFSNSGFLFVLLLTVFLVITHNTCNGTKNSKALSSFVAVTKTWIAMLWHGYVAFYDCWVVTSKLMQDLSKVLITLSIWHWNLNSISAHNYAKIYLLKAYIAIHKFDFICISETYVISMFLSPVLMTHSRVTVVCTLFFLKCCDKPAIFICNSGLVMYNFFFK